MSIAQKRIKNVPELIIEFQRVSLQIFTVIFSTLKAEKVFNEPSGNSMLLILNLG